MITYALGGESTGVYNDGTMVSQLKIRIQEKTHVPVVFQSIIRDSVTLEDSELSPTMSPLSLVISYYRFTVRMANSHSDSSHTQREALRDVINWANTDPERAIFAIASCYDWYILPCTIHHSAAPNMGIDHWPLSSRNCTRSRMTINKAIIECRISGCYGFSVNLPTDAASRMEQQYHTPGCDMTIASYTMHEKMCDELVYVAFDERNNGANGNLRARGFGHPTCDDTSRHLAEDECGLQTIEPLVLMYVVQHDVLFTERRAHRLNLVSAAIQITSKKHGWESQRLSSRSIQTLMQLCPSTLVDTIVNEFGIDALSEDVCDDLEGYETQLSYVGIVSRLSGLRSKGDPEFLATLEHLLRNHESALLDAVSFALRKSAPIENVGVLQALRRCAEETLNASILKTLRIVSSPGARFWVGILEKIQTEHTDQKIVNQINGYINRSMGSIPRLRCHKGNTVPA